MYKSSKTRSIKNGDKGKAYSPTNHCIQPANDIKIGLEELAFILYQLFINSQKDQLANYERGAIKFKRQNNRKKQ